MKCPYCKGTGIRSIPEDSIEFQCEECDGQGVVDDLEGDDDED